MIKQLKFEKGPFAYNIGLENNVLHIVIKHNLQGMWTKNIATAINSKNSELKMQPEEIFNMFESDGVDNMYKIYYPIDITNQKNISIIIISYAKDSSYTIEFEPCIPLQDSTTMINTDEIIFNNSAQDKISVNTHGSTFNNSIILLLLLGACLSLRWLYTNNSTNILNQQSKLQYNKLNKDDYILFNKYESALELIQKSMKNLDDKITKMEKEHEYYHNEINKKFVIFVCMEYLMIIIGVFIIGIFVRIIYMSCL